MVSLMYGETCGDHGRKGTSNAVAVGVALVYGVAGQEDLDHLSTNAWSEFV